MQVSSDKLTRHERRHGARQDLQFGRLWQKECALVRSSRILIARFVLIVRHGFSFHRKKRLGQHKNNIYS